MIVSHIAKASKYGNEYKRTAFFIEMQSFLFKLGLSAFPTAEGLFFSSVLCYTFLVSFKV